MNILEITISRGTPRRLAALAVAVASVPALAQQAELRIDPAKTTVKFTLDAALHTVHGTFLLKPGALQVDLSSGQLSGEISVDAHSGLTGNGMRDRKMHQDVLDCDRYPDISFHPDRANGVVARMGESFVMVHGIFSIHGVNREITVPALVEMTAGSWTASVHFTMPYAKWGMKNPSNLFLRVSDSVEIEVEAAGSVIEPAAAPRSPGQ